MKQFLQRMFLENLGLKFVALALSFVLLLYVQGEKRRDAVTGALVKLTLVPPPGKVLTSDSVDKLTVILRGPRGAVQEVTSEGIEPIEIDLTGRQPGPLRFTSEMIKVPRGLTVESIQPPQLDLTWEDRAMRRVPIAPRFVGRPAPGYRVSRVDVVPKEAEVIGPKSAVEGIAEVDLRETQLDGRDQSFESTVPIRPGRKFVQVRPDAARVWVELVAEVTTRRIARVPVKTLHVPDDVEAEVKPEVAFVVTLEGPAPTLDNLDATGAQAIVDLKEIPDLKAGMTYMRPAKIEPLPKGVRVVTIVPPAFNVIITRKAKQREGP